jgi:hypothetical protein
MTAGTITVISHLPIQIMIRDIQISIRTEISITGIRNGMTGTITIGLTVVTVRLNGNVMK